MWVCVCSKDRERESFKICWFFFFFSIKLNYSFIYFSDIISFLAALFSLCIYLFIYFYVCFSVKALLKWKRLPPSLCMYVCAAVQLNVYLISEGFFGNCDQFHFFHSKLVSTKLSQTWKRQFYWYEDSWFHWSIQTEPLTDKILNSSRQPNRTHTHIHTHKHTHTHI